MVSRLRLERIKRGQTLYDVHRETGLPPSRLSLIERGIADAHPGERAKLAAFLEVKESKLFPVAMVGKVSREEDSARG